MSRKLMTTIVLAVGLAGTTALPGAAAPASPGACNMLNVSTKGMDGMLKASDQGLGNMMELVLASEAAGCPL
jgi:hypothetical protein